MRALSCLVFLAVCAACSESNVPPGSGSDAGLTDEGLNPADGGDAATPADGGDGSIPADAGPADSGLPTDTGATDSGGSEVMVGPEGGQVSSDDGVLQVVIPPGAVATPIAVKISVATSTALPSDNVGTAYYVEPEGFVFSQPVLLSIDYGSFELGDTPPETLQLATYARGVWAPVITASNDIANTTLSMRVPHFSYWSVRVDTTAPRQQNFDPCLCHDQSWSLCCNEFRGFYEYSDDPRVCRCAGGGAGTIDFHRCLIARSGYEPYCTVAELDCCEAAGGYVNYLDGTCYCSKRMSCGSAPGLPSCPDLDELNDVLVELTRCMETTKECGGDRSLCEHHRANQSLNIVNGMCVDTWSDPQNCGGPGRACAAGESCSGGLCGCPAPYTGCPHGCVDLNGDRLNCGQCGVSCYDGNYCVNGSCTDQVDCSAPPPGIFESEPNNTPEQATPLPVDLDAVACGRPSGVNLRSQCPGPADWFRFTIPPSEDGKRLRVQYGAEVDNGPGPQITLSLWGNGQMLEQFVGFAANTPSGQHVLNSAANSRNGVYTLSVSCGPGQIDGGGISGLSFSILP